MLWLQLFLFFDIEPLIKLVYLAKELVGDVMGFFSSLIMWGILFILFDKSILLYFVKLLSDYRFVFCIQTVFITALKRSKLWKIMEFIFCLYKDTFDSSEDFRLFRHKFNKCIYLERGVILLKEILSRLLIVKIAWMKESSNIPMLPLFLLKRKNKSKY